jgi:Dolichyl-phosphate-mannose-protein mannosyltransferase
MYHVFGVPTAKPRRWVLAVFVIAFFVIAASRITRLPNMNLERDEVWSVWQTLGTAEETMRWTPYDWSPAYYLLIHTWQNLTGISPFGLRMFTVLIMLVTAALIYRVGNRLFGRTTGFLAMLAFSAFGYSLFASTLLRAYLLLVTLFTLNLWVVLIYFEKSGWSRRQHIFFAVTIALLNAAMFFTHFAGFLAWAVLLFISLLLSHLPLRQWLMRTVLPVSLSILFCVPEALSKLEVVGIKNNLVNLYIPYVPPPMRIINIYWDFVGWQAVLWAALFVLASVLVIEHWRQRRFAIMIFLLTVPIHVFPIASPVDAFNPRHLPWVMLSMAFWLGWGLSQLPRTAIVGLCAVFMGVMTFDYIPMNERYEVMARVPLVTSFNSLRQHVRGGDAILVDKQCKQCAPVDPEEWDYFIRAYFPNTVTYIPQWENWARYRRVWFVSVPGQEDEGTFNQLNNTYALSYTLGEKNLTFRLYEAPPNRDGIAFENGMIFNGYEIYNPGGTPLAFHEGGLVTIRAWWSVAQPLTQDYSVGTYISTADEGLPVGQFDGPPQLISGLLPTSQWQVGRYYVEERQVRLSFPLKQGDLLVRMAVYQWWDSVRINAPGLDADLTLLLGKIYVKAL